MDFDTMKTFVNISKSSSETFNGHRCRNTMIIIVNVYYLLQYIESTIRIITV